MSQKNIFWRKSTFRFFREQNRNPRWFLCPNQGFGAFFIVGGMKIIRKNEKKKFFQILFFLRHIKSTILLRCEISSSFDESNHTKNCAQFWQIYSPWSKNPLKTIVLNRIWRFFWNPRRICRFPPVCRPSLDHRNFFHRPRHITKVYIFEKYSSRSLQKHSLLWV